MKKVVLLFTAFVCIVGCSSVAYARMPYIGDKPMYVNGSFSEVDGYYDEYTLYDSVSFEEPYGWVLIRFKKNEYFVIGFEGKHYDYSQATIRIPDKIYNKRMRREVTSLSGSCAFKTFDMNPENKYMKCVDNVVFSKDGKTLISYAQYDERTEYAIPNGTETIGSGAFWKCKNLKVLTLPNSVKELETDAFSYMNLNEVTLPVGVENLPEDCFYSNQELVSLNIPKNSKLKYIGSHALSLCGKLEEIYLPSFEITINKRALGVFQDREIPISLKSYVQPKLNLNGNTIAWDKIPNTSYYEIYQKLSDGEYKMITTTKATSCRFSALKPENEYTFAVKPIAVISADDYNKEDDEKYFPETFTIEGTMSEDITATGK